MSLFSDCWMLILEEMRNGLNTLDEREVMQFVKAVEQAEHVFCVGVGRVLLSLQSFAKRLNHIGIPCWCVGDTNEPAIGESDVLVVGSGSGESVVPVAIARVAKRHGAGIIHIGSNQGSSLAEITDVFVRIPVKTRLGLSDELDSAQIMTSLFEQCLYVLGDAVCMMIAGRRKLNINNLRQYHANLE